MLQKMTLNQLLEKSIAYEILAILAGTLFMAICAQIAVPTPFTPVPVTLQVLGVFFVGGVLGPKRAALCMAAYLAEGLIGLPVFAQGWGGLVVLTRPSFGYLLGYIPAAYLMGLISLSRSAGEGRVRVRKYLLASVVSLCAIYICGLIWLAPFVGTTNVLAMGLYPFIAIDLAKAVIAASILSGANWWMQK